MGAINLFPVAREKWAGRGGSGQDVVRTWSGNGRSKTTVVLVVWSCVVVFLPVPFAFSHDQVRAFGSGRQQRRLRRTKQWIDVHGFKLPPVEVDLPHEDGQAGDGGGVGEPGSVFPLG